MAARDSRNKKDVERFMPPKSKADADGKIYEGSGTKLADIPIVPVTLTKVDADHDLLKAFHALLYGVIGKKTVRKKNIRSFSGFPEDDDREARTKKLAHSRKWTVAALKDLCTLLGLDKAGSKADVVDRLMSFLSSPDPSASKGPPPKKPRKAAAAATTTKKRKSTDKEDSGGKKGGSKKEKEKEGKRTKKVKREFKPRPLSGYMMFCKDARPKVVKANPEFKATEIMAKLGEMWNKCSDAEKEQYKQRGIKEFEKKQEATADQENGEGENEDGGGGDEE